MPEIAYINGRFCPLAEAVVSVEDRGYQFADGVYEVVGTYGGCPYALEPHLARLQGNLTALHLPLDICEYGLRAKLMEGIERSGFGEILVYIQVTRGIAPRQHEFPTVPIDPTVVMTFKELRRLPRDIYDRGVEVISTEDLRWKRCDIKTIALLPNILAKQTATQAGAFEALLVDSEGRVTEGASTSAFRVKAGRLCTAPIGPHILPSITRGILLDLARELGIPIDEEFSTLDQFKEADEVFIAGTTLEAMSVVKVDDAVIGAGTPGPITQQIRAAFMETLNLT